MPGPCGAARTYRSRHPESTSLYCLVESFYDEVKGCWEECFERLHGHWRGYWDRVIRAYIDCGNFKCGFARVRCPACATEYLVVNDPEILNQEQAATYCGVSTRTIRRLVSEGLLLKEQIVPYAPWEIRRADLDSEPVREVVRHLKNTGKLVLEPGQLAGQESLF